MAPEAAAEAQQPSTSKSKKNRKKKSKAKANGANDAGSKHTSDHEDDGGDDVPDTPIDDHNQQSSVEQQKDVAVLPLTASASNTATNGIHKTALPEAVPHEESETKIAVKDDTAARLAAAAKERDELRDQVVELRKSLETLQRQHEEEVAKLERDTNEQSQKSRSFSAETEDRLAVAAREAQEYKERARKLEEDAKHAREEQQEQLARHTEQEERRQAQQKAASDHEEELVAAKGERDELKEQLSNMQESLNTSEQQRKEEAATAAKRAEEQASQMKVVADKDKQLIEAVKENEDIRKQLSDLKKSLEDARQQHKEETARLAAENEAYASQLKASEQQTAALSQSEQDKEDLRKQLAEAQNSLEIIRQQHVDEVEILTKQNEDRSVQSAGAKELEEKLATVEKERDDLKAQVSKLSENQGDSQQSHEEELRNLRAELEESQTAKEQAQSQHKALLSKVNTIRAQLGERLKADAEDLRLSRARIEELEDLDNQHQASNESLQKQITELSNERDERAREVAELRNRANMTQQNWISERDDLIRREALAREEFETAKQAMQDWEVLAMEERSIREGLGDRVAELEDQLETQEQAYERAASERDDQSGTVDGLQRALQDIQEARKQELRETVETYQTQLEDLRKQLKLAEDSAKASQSELDTLKQDLEKALPFEKEVKEKNLLIGKLRHEAVILNDHLTKALKYIKRSKPDDTVDKQLITNSLLQFLSLDRSDPKKFQVLHLISAILAWTDEQNESAGLSRPGASHQPINPNQSLRASGPLSPFVRRVSSAVNFGGGGGSTTSLPGLTSSMIEGGALGSPRSPGGKESLSDLWSGFLEREAQEGLAAGGGSRRVSMSSNHSAGARPAMGSPTVSRYALPKMEEGESG